MFNGCSAIPIMNGTNFFFIRSCRNLEKENGAPNPFIPLISLIGLLKKQRSTESISAKKYWASLKNQCYHPIRKQKKFTIKRNGQDMKLYWTFIPTFLLP